MAFYVAQDLCLEKKFFGKWSDRAHTLKKESGHKKSSKNADDEGKSAIYLFDEHLFDG